MALNWTTLSVEVDWPTIHAAGRENENRPFGSAKSVKAAPDVAEPAAVVEPAVTGPVTTDPVGRVPTTAEAELAAVVGAVVEPDAADEAGRGPVTAEAEPTTVGTVVATTDESVAADPAGRVALAATVVGAIVGAAVVGVAAFGVSVAILPPQAVRSAVNSSNAITITITINPERWCITPSIMSIVRYRHRQQARA